MQYCTPKLPTPCHQYDRTKPHELDAFIKDNTGQGIAHFDATDTAIIYSNVKGETRLMYLKPGYWIRAVGPGQFSVCTDSTFQASYNLIDEADNQPINLGAILEMTVEQANAFKDAMNQLK